MSCVPVWMFDTFFSASAYDCHPTGKTSRQPGYVVRLNSHDVCMHATSLCVLVGRGPYVREVVVDSEQGLDEVEGGQVAVRERRQLRVQHLGGGQPTTPTSAVSRSVCHQASS